MYVKNISLNNYRNYKDLDLDLSPGLNVIYGHNAQGKTNILESIYYAATARSHRTHYDRELINWDANEAHIRVRIVKKHEDCIDIHLRKNGKKGIAINRVPINKLGELYGNINVILFSPEDLSLIKKGPAERRKFLDIEICQIDKIYIYHLGQYHKILKQRNNLLKAISMGRGNQDTLEVWDMQLVQYGLKIMERRRRFIKEIKGYVEEIHGQITNDLEKIELRYEENVKPDSFLQQLTKNRKRDLKIGSTSVGPHRDDLSFIVNGTDLRSYGSQGQHRTVALTLKLAEINLIRDEVGHEPVLLLDDVLSELDQQRQQHLMKALKKTQTIVTCTGVEDFVRKGLEVDRLIYVDAGQASPVIDET